LKVGLDLPPQQRVYGGFFIYSFCMGSLPPRLPDLQRMMQIEEGALGFGLIGAAAGTLVSLSFFGPILERVGFRRSILAMIPLLALLYALASFAEGPLSFFLLLFPVGIVIGGIEIILNLEADRTEHMVGYRIMNRAHAFWSFGFFSAGFISGLVAQSGLSPQIHLFLMVPLVIVGVVLILGRFDPAPHRTGTLNERPPRFAVPTMAIMVLVAVTLSAMIMEGAGIDWSAIYMRDVFAVSPFLSGFAVALGAGAQAVTRFFADPFVERYSPTAVSRILLGVLGIGVLLVFFAPSKGLALLGDFPARDVRGSAAHRSTGADQRCIAGAGLVRRVFAGTASARLRCRAFRHPMVIWHRATAGSPEHRLCRSARDQAAEAPG
jgi:MFS family permease